jgi:hypothetical protein
MKTLGTSVAAVTGIYFGLRTALFGIQRGLDAAIGSIVRQAKEYRALSVRLGDSVEALSELEFVAEQGNISFRNLTLGMQRATRRIAEASTGTGVAVDALKELNLSSSDLMKLAPSQQLEMIADAMVGLGSDADRVRLAFKLFDAEGVGLLQIMTKGSAGIREMRARARELGATFDEELVKSTEEARKKMSELSVAVGNFGQEFTRAVAQLKTEDVDNIAKLSAALGTFVGTSTSLTVDVSFRNLTGAPAKELFAGIRALFGGGRPAFEELPKVDVGALPFQQTPTRGLPRSTTQGVSPLDLSFVYSDLVAGPKPNFKQIAMEVDREFIKLIGRMQEVQISTKGNRLAVDAWGQHMVETTRIADEMGATVVDIGVQFADSMAFGAARAIVEMQGFAEAAKRIIKNLASAIIAEALRVAARAFVLGILQRVLGIQLPGLGGGGAEILGSGGPSAPFGFNPLGGGSAASNARSFAGGGSGGNTIVIQQSIGFGLPSERLLAGREVASVFRDLGILR